MFRIILVGVLLAVLVVGIALVSPHSDCIINVVESNGETHQVTSCQ